MGINDVHPFLDRLKSDFYLDEDMIAEAIQHHSSFKIIHRAPMFKVDVFIPSMSPFTQSELERPRKKIVARQPDIAAYFASPEDTVLAKLNWYRIGGETSERQWNDVTAIFQISAGNLDLDYLRQWGKELNVSDLLEKAISEI